MNKTSLLPRQSFGASAYQRIVHTWEKLILAVHKLVQHLPRGHFVSFSVEFD
jgi:hypothetical protein